MNGHPENAAGAGGPESPDGGSRVLDRPALESEAPIGDTVRAGAPAGRPGQPAALSDKSSAGAGDAAGGTGLRFHLVVLGSGPVGKTALINALLGRSEGRTGATIGTTRRGATSTHTVEGVEETLLLTDTPGLGESGAEGLALEADALEIATRADLLLFVLDHDLTRTQRQVLVELARMGKRLLVVLNKKDRLTEPDRDLILDRLRLRLEGLVPNADIVAVAADPSPVPVRVRKADGTVETVLEAEPPDLNALEQRVAAVLEQEGPALRAGNLLLRARRREQAEQEQLARRRLDQALAVIERHQWIAAATAFANPVLALGPMAAGAVQLRMLSELAALYDVPLSSEDVEIVGARMVQTFFQLGIAEAAAGLLAGVLRFNPLGFAAGGAVQAVTMAYLTRLTGDSFLEYLDRNQTWGEGGMRSSLTRHLESTRASGWFLEFARKALRRLFAR